MATKEEALAEITNAGELMKKAPDNIDISEAKDLLKRAMMSAKLGAWTKAYDYAKEAGQSTESVRALYMELKDLYTALADKINNAYSMSVPIPQLASRNNEIQELIKTGKLKEAKEKIAGLDDQITRMVPIYKQYQELDMLIRDTIGRGIEIKGADEKITQIIECFNEGQWEKAKNYIYEANAIIEKMCEEDKNTAPEAHTVLTEVYETLSQAPPFLKLEEAARLYNTAKNMYVAQSYRVALDTAERARDNIASIKKRYNEVLDAITAAYDNVEETKTKPGYEDLDYVTFEGLIESAKASVMNNEFDMALEYTHQCLEGIEMAKRPVVERVRGEVETRVKAVMSELPTYESVGIDTTEIKEALIDVQRMFADAQEYPDFVRCHKALDRVDEHLQAAREEYALLNDTPRYITVKLKEAKNLISQMRSSGANVSLLYNHLDEAIEEYSLAEGDSEMESAKKRTQNLLDAIDKSYESVVQMRKLRESIEAILDKAYTTLEDLKEGGYVVDRLQTEMESKRNMSDTAKTIKGLELILDDTGKWLTIVEQTPRIDPAIFNKKEQCRKLILDINKALKKLEGEDVVLSSLKPKVDLLNRMQPEANSHREYDDILAKGTPMLEEMERMLAKAKEDKANHTQAKTDLEAVKVDLKIMEDKCDVTKVTQGLALAEVALASKQFGRAVEFLTQCKSEISSIKDESSASVDVTLRTDNLMPNIWDQSQLTITNNGKVVLKELDIALEGPVEVRRIKPLALLGLKEQNSFEIGVQFKGAGKLPLDLKVYAVRQFDGLRVQIRKDLWVTISPGQSAPQTMRSGIEWESPRTSEDEIFAKIEKVAALRDKGIISVEEFEKKKKELLDKI